MRQWVARARASSPFALELPEWLPPLTTQGLRARAQEQFYGRRGWGFQSVLTPEVSKVRIERIAQWVRDFAGDPSGLRVLDLGAYEGAHSVALARLGAEVVAVEGREDNARHIHAEKERRDLDNLTVVVGDAREEIREQGRFDVVLCLGLLYHLTADELGPFVDAIVDTGCELAIVETQIGLSSTKSFSYRGHTYRGIEDLEEIERPAASLVNTVSFWPTKRSLLNLLTRAGFTSIAEAHVPNIAVLAAFRDHIALIAKRSA
jgi:SAM-dependent methyltransferase